MPKVNETNSINLSKTGQKEPRQRSHTKAKHHGGSNAAGTHAAEARGRKLTTKPRSQRKKNKKTRKSPPQKAKSDRYNIPTDAHRRLYSAKEVIAILKRNGWTKIKKGATGKGSHTIFENKKKSKLGKIVFSSIKTLGFNSVVRTLDQAGLLNELAREKPSARHKTPR